MSETYEQVNPLDLIDAEDKNALATGNSQSVGTLSPLAIMQKMVEQKISVEAIQGMMVIHKDWEANEARKAYHLAMAECKKDIPVITKDRDGNYGKYASLGGTIEKITPILSQHGFSVSWSIAQPSIDVMSITCILTHAKGHSESITMSGPVMVSLSKDGKEIKNKLQAIGEAKSYLERYTLFAMLGLAAVDDDRNAAGPVEFISAEDVIKLEADLVEVKTDKDKFLKFMGVDKLELITKDNFKKAINVIEQKRRNGKA